MQCRLGTIQNSEPRHGIVQLPAILAENCLNGHMQAIVRLPRQLRAIAAPATFKPVGLAHTLSVSSSVHTNCHIPGSRSSAISLHPENVSHSVARFGVR